MIKPSDLKGDTGSMEHAKLHSRDVIKQSKLHENPTGKNTVLFNKKFQGKKRKLKGNLYIKWVFRDIVDNGNVWILFGFLFEQTVIFIYIRSFVPFKIPQ